MQCSIHLISPAATGDSNQIIHSLIDFLRFASYHNIVRRYQNHRGVFMSAHVFFLNSFNNLGEHTCKCIRRFAGIYAYCWYFIDRKW